MQFVIIDQSMITIQCSPLGVHAVVMRIWKNNSGPVMQLIHSAYALGAFLAPLVAKPFLTENNPVNSTCTDLLNMHDMAGSGGSHGTARCLAMILENCSNATNVEGSVDITVTIDCPNEPSLYFAWAFWITTIPILIPLPAFVFYACRYQCFWRKATSSVTTNGESDSKMPNDKAKNKTIVYPDTIPYKIFLLGFLTTITLVYVGMEMTYGNFIFAYSVNSELEFSKSQAALLSSVFWGSFTFFRLFAFPLSLCGIPSWVLLSVNVGGGLLGSVVLVIWPLSPTAVWLATAILGCSMASIFPNVMVWLSEHGPATGKATGLLIIGATMGDVSLPAAVGTLVTMSSTIALPYFTLAAMLSCTVLLVVLFIVTRLWTNYYLKNRKGEDTSRYARLQFSDDDEEEEEKEEEEEEKEEEKMEMQQFDEEGHVPEANSINRSHLIVDEDIIGDSDSTLL